MTLRQQIKTLERDWYCDRSGDYTPAPIAPQVIQRRRPPLTALKYITAKEYWSLQDKQNNRCAICDAQPNGRALHLDHCHTSNKIRALICHGCNIAIGMIKEDSQTARAIADYLDHHASKHETCQTDFSRGNI